VGHICASSVVLLVAPHVARHHSNSKMSSPHDYRPPRALRASRRLPFHRASRDNSAKKEKKETPGIIFISRPKTRKRDDTGTNDVSLLKSYLDVVERPFTEEFHFLRGEFSHDVRALCVARCSFSRFSQHTQVGVVGGVVCCKVVPWVDGPFFF